MLPNIDTNSLKQGQTGASTGTDRRRAGNPEAVGEISVARDLADGHRARGRPRHEERIVCG
jgi:hypothetical protein